MSSLLRAWLEDTANGTTPISELSALRHDLLQVRHLMAGRRALSEDGVSGLLRALVEMRDKFAQIARIVRRVVFINPQVRPMST